MVLDKTEEKGASSPNGVGTQRGLFDWDKKPYPDKWDFKKEPVIEGTVTKIGSVTLRGREAPYMHVRTKQGERTVWLTMVIQGVVDDEKVEEGDLVGIKYLGEAVGENGLDYHNFDVRVQKAIVGG